MMGWIQRLWSLFPPALLIAVVGLWIAGNVLPFEAAAWWNRAWVFGAFESQSFRVMANWDSSAHPVRRVWPYIRLWWVRPGDPWIPVQQFVSGNYEPPQYLSESGNYFGSLEGYQSWPAGSPPAFQWHGLRVKPGDADLASRYGNFDLDRHILFDVPYWIAAAAAGIIAIPWLIRRIKTMRGSAGKPGHCPTCGYDLRASAQRCPECGLAIDPHLVWVRRRTLRGVLRHIDLHIRTHALGVLALVVLICVLILIRTWPVQYVVAPIEVDKIPGRGHYNDDPLTLNVIDLCHWDNQRGWSMTVQDVDALRTDSGIAPDSYFGVGNGLLFLSPFPDDMAKFVAAINRRRGAQK